MKTDKTEKGRLSARPPTNSPTQFSDWLLKSPLGTVIAGLRDMLEHTQDFEQSQFDAVKEQIVDEMLKRNLRVDHREYWVMLDYMAGLGWEVCHLNTGEGDYCSERISIERKATDLTPSVWDDRLARQLTAMNEEADCSFVVITRSWAKLKMDLRRRKVNQQTLISFVASMTARGYPPLFIPDEYDAARFMDKLAHIMADDKNRLYSPRPRKPSVEEYRNAVIESLPTVGYQTRKKLLKVFPTIKELSNASVGDLMEIDGIGKKTAQKIHATLN